jgi:hypothetical protein
LFGICYGLDDLLIAAIFDKVLPFLTTGSIGGPLFLVKGYFTEKMKSGVLLFPV